MIEDENTPGGIAKAIGLAMIFACALILLVGCGRPGMLEKVWEDAKATCASHGGLASARYDQGIMHNKDQYGVTAVCKNNVRIEYNVELK